MFHLRHLALVSALAVVAPAAAWSVEPQRGSPNSVQPAYNEGFTRGQRAGVEDARRGDAFQFADESDYRRGDAGYRSEFGNRDRYRDTFRQGFEAGYRVGYGGRYDAGRGGLPPRFNDGGRAVGRYDQAYQGGFSDGYEAGLNDARGRRRYDPISESRYRSADHGYDRRFGSKDAYKNSYRDAFKEGYDRGYQDGRQYGTRRWFGFEFSF